jgi:hypothetical protein
MAQVNDESEHRGGIKEQMCRRTEEQSALQSVSVVGSSLPKYQASLDWESVRQMRWHDCEGLLDVFLVTKPDKLTDSIPCHHNQLATKIPSVQSGVVGKRRVLAPLPDSHGFPLNGTSGLA